MDECKPLHLGRLTYEALYGGLSYLGLEITPAQMLELAGKMDKTGDGFVTFEVGRCRITVLKPVLKAPMVSVLEATI